MAEGEGVDKHWVEAISEEIPFDRIIDRRGTESIKWTLYEEDVLPMWVADMDFRCANPVVEALRKRTEHGIFGYPNEPEGLRAVITERLKRRYDWTSDP